MSRTINAYTTIAYGLVIVGMLKEKFIKQYPYMEGENMAVFLPERFQNKALIPRGLLFNSINEGFIIRE